jgi:hypothetical protein
VSIGCHSPLGRVGSVMTNQLLLKSLPGGRGNARFPLAPPGLRCLFAMVVDIVVRNLERRRLPADVAGPAGQVRWRRHPTMPSRRPARLRRIEFLSRSRMG